MLLLDVIHLGKQDEGDTPLPAVLMVGLAMTALSVGVWKFSAFRYRTIALLAGLFFIWGVFLLPPGISGWDIVMDVGLLAAILTQLVSAARANS